MKTPIPHAGGLQLIAVVEALKGLAAIAVLIGVLDLMNQDMRAIAMALIGRFGLNPQGHYSSLLLHYAELLPQADRAQIIGLGVGYAALRFLETYGLWCERAWGQYLAAVSGAIYIPFEIMHLIRQPDLTSVFIVTINLIVVVYLSHHLYREKQAHKQQAIDGM